MKKCMERLEALQELGGIRKDVTLLAISGVAVICSLCGVRFGAFDPAWLAIVLCGVPIVLEATIGLVTAFDIKADVLVSLALIASVCIGEIFAAGEVAFIMQLGGLLEELTVAKARAGIEKLVHLTPQTARVISGGASEAHDEDHQAQYDLLHDAQLHRDCSGDDGHTQPRRRRAGSQRRLGACDYKFRILTELRSKKARPFLKSLHFDCA